MCQVRCYVASCYTTSEVFTLYEIQMVHPFHIIQTYALPFRALYHVVNFKWQSCQAVVRQSSGSRQPVVSQSSASRQAIVRQSPGSHQAVARQSSGSHQAVVRQQSGSHQAVYQTERLFILVHKKLLQCDSYYFQQWYKWYIVYLNQIKGYAKTPIVF